MIITFPKQYYNFTNIFITYTLIARILRFPEFTDEWNSLSLNDVSNDCSYGVSASATEFDREYKYIRITDIDDDTHKFTPSPLVSPKGDIDSKYILHEGDLVFARTGATVGKSYLYEPSDGTLVYAGYLIRFHIDRAVPKFIFYLTNRSYYWNWVSIMSVRSGQPGINMEEYKKLPIIIPSNHEQEKITSFLSKIDKKIDLLRDKKDEYIEFKRYLLQNLFPQNGETAPKLRFIKYNDEWKTCKLNEVVEIPEKNKITSITNKKLLTVKLHTNGIEINENTVPKLTKKGRPYYIRHTNEILIGRQNFHNGGIGILPEELDGGICSNAITSFNVIKDIALTKYVYYYLSRTDYYKRSEKYIGGTGQKEYSEKTLLSLNISFPSTKEQEKIASFLSFVDKKIDLLNQEIEQLEEYKKGLLQKMFIWRVYLFYCCILSSEYLEIMFYIMIFFLRYVLLTLVSDLMSHIF